VAANSAGLETPDRPIGPDDIGPDDIGPDCLGLDFGMNTLFATSAGDLLGRGFLVWLRRVDTQLSELTASLQRQNIKLSASRRYRKFQSRIRAHVRNEINRIMNQLVELYHPKTLVLERLDFRYGGLSRTMNRLLSRCGRGAVADKLKSLAEEQGIAVVLVDPAYTSQQCSRCSYIDHRNRHGARFFCRHCGYKSHADINASRSILLRRSLVVDWSSVDAGKSSKEAVLETVDLAFEKRWGVAPAVLRQRGVLSPSNKPTKTGPVISSDPVVECCPDCVGHTPPPLRPFCPESWPSGLGQADASECSGNEVTGLHDRALRQRPWTGLELRTSAVGLVGSPVGHESRVADELQSA
jgi:IS605 OrfB family transposase